MHLMNMFYTKRAKKKKKMTKNSKFVSEKTKLKIFLYRKPTSLWDVKRISNDRIAQLPLTFCVDFCFTRIKLNNIY